MSGRRITAHFFRKCRALLAPDGLMLLHTIARADGPAATDPFLAKYIFPGGYIPALSQIAPALERERLWLTDLEVLRLHYARTLACWYERTGRRAASDRAALRRALPAHVALLSRRRRSPPSATMLSASSSSSSPAAATRRRSSATISGMPSPLSVTGAQLYRN